MSVKKYVVKIGRQGHGIHKGQILTDLNRDRIQMLLDHGLIEEVKAESVHKKTSNPNGFGNEVSKKK